jgi:uncharacterized protein YaeQ
MSFVDRFYSFTIELTAAERNLYEKLRFKIPKYPDEELGDLLARVFSYLHCYAPEMQFSANPADHQSPTLFSLSPSGNFESYAFVGLPDLKSLRLSVRQQNRANCSVYFYRPEQLERFCHQLRGSKENWVTEIKFFMIRHPNLESLIISERVSISWQIIAIDDIFYLENGDHSQQVHFEAIDIWAAFQESLKEHYL